MIALNKSFIHSFEHPFYNGPGVSLYLLHEVTGHPELPKIKLAQKAHIDAQV